jgi:hypothetical protein
VSKPSPAGVLAHHPAGFALVVPWHIAKRPESDRPPVLGVIRVIGRASLSLTGDVPGSWLVNLNAAPVEVEVDE